jgi:hypothetical protein
MPYAPKVKNRAGEIYAEGITNAATFESRGIKGSALAQAEGIERRAAGFASGIETAGAKIAGGISKLGEAWQNAAVERKAEAAKWDTSLGKIGALQSLGYLSPHDADALGLQRRISPMGGTAAGRRLAIVFAGD